MSKKLLLADDSITIQKVIGITFANEDYELTVVDNGDAALEKARRENPDLILADVFMPGKNGYELCAAVRQDPTLRGVPVLLLTGTFEPFDENKARVAGADSWIAKPFESQALIDRVEELLARPRQTAEPAAETPVAAAAAPPAPAPEDAADIWGDLAESEVAEAEPAQPDEFFAEASSTADPATPANEEATALEDDIWGAVSFDEDDLLAGEPLDETAEDIWGAMEEEDAVAEAPSVSVAEESFLFEDEPLAEAPPPVESAPPPPLEDFVFEEEEPFAPTESGELEELGEEDILPLDEFDILDEEELAEMAEPQVRDEFVFAEVEENFPAEAPAAPVEAGDVLSFGEETVAAEEPIAFEEEFPLTEEGPEWGIAEGPGIVAIEPAAPAAEEFFVIPAETAIGSEPPAAPAAAAVVEERVRALSEEELSQIVERVAGSVIERLAGSVLEKIAWEVVPDLAENLVREEIRKIKEGAQ
jgi:CheY-like chemotaxis protein